MLVRYQLGASSGRKKRGGKLWVLRGTGSWGIIPHQIATNHAQGRCLCPEAAIMAAGNVKEVRINADVFLAMLSHALSTETQEVMGMLIGKYQVRLPYMVCLILPQIVPPEHLLSRQACAWGAAAAGSTLLLFPTPLSALMSSIMSGPYSLRCMSRALSPHVYQFSPQSDPISSCGQPDESDGTCVAHVSALCLLQRQTRAKDRCEIAVEHLVAATEKADALKLGVVGWYHSHPHITVHPSHVGRWFGFTLPFPQSLLSLTPAHLRAPFPCL